MYTMNYKKALLGKLFSELNNMDFVNVLFWTITYKKLIYLTFILLQLYI